MSLDLIAAARRKKAEAEQRLQALLAEVDQAQRDVAEWDTWFAKTEILADGLTTNGQTEPQEADATGSEKRPVKVQRESLVGWAALLILEKGPLPLRGIAEGVTAMGKGEGPKDLPTAINSAMWRRKDLFERRSHGLYHLLTTEIEFVD